MTALGVLLLALGLADVVSVRRRSVAELIARQATAGTLAGVFGLAAGLRGLALACTIGYALFLATAWTFARRTFDTERAAAWTLGGLACLLFGAFAGVALLDANARSVAAEWLYELPYTGVDQASDGRILYIAGATAFLTTPANVLVRLALRCVGRFEKSEQRLRGGRLIGPVERLLIFFLALAGEPTAAALVVGAKSLLRFPEISAGSNTDRVGEEASSGDIDTEYLLVGSLVSWSIALAAVPFAG